MIEGLSACAEAAVVNQDIDQLPEGSPISVRQSSVALSSVATGDRLRLTIYTQASGLAQSGITHHRTILATCWEITVEKGSPQPHEISGVPCSGALIERLNPTEVVPLDDLDLTRS